MIVPEFLCCFRNLDLPQLPLALKKNVHIYVGCLHSPKDWLFYGCRCRYKICRARPSSRKSFKESLRAFCKMRVFVAFEGLYESFDISSEDTVKDVKLMIKVRTWP